METPLVSVVTVTRNRGYLLGRCISSVLSQTYTNIEHIVVDGASDDNTDEVVAGFHDDRLKFVKLDYNWPIKETIDHGISLSKGKYIAFLDSDDEYQPSKIEKQVSLIESLPDDYGFVYCWMTYYDSSNNNTPYFLHDPKLKGFICDEVLPKPIITGTPTLLFHAEILKKLNGWKSPDEIGIISDWEMCARACQLCKVDYVPESLVNVYVNHGSVRQSEDSKYYDNNNKRLIRFHKYFLKQFATNFKRRPDYALNHLFAIVRYEYRLKHYGSAVLYLFKMFITSPNYCFKKLRYHYD